jgi:hypothetical protein
MTLLNHWYLYCPFTFTLYKRKMNEHVCSSKERSKGSFSYKSYNFKIWKYNVGEILVVKWNGFEILNFIADSTLSIFYHCYELYVTWLYGIEVSPLIFPRMQWWVHRQEWYETTIFGDMMFLVSSYIFYFLLTTFCFCHFYKWIFWDMMAGVL